MLAKTQCKVDQHLIKMQLKNLLRERSLYKKDDLENLSKHEKEKLYLLNKEIADLRDFLNANKPTPAQVKIRH